MFQRKGWAMVREAFQHPMSKLIVPWTTSVVSQHFLSPCSPSPEVLLAHSYQEKITGTFQIINPIKKFEITAS